MYRLKFDALLNENTFDNPLVCEIDGNIIKMFKTIDTIYFYLQNDCLLEFDDMEVEQLEKIFNHVNY